MHDGHASKFINMANKIETLCSKVCDEYDADLIFYFGPVERPKDDFLIDECPKKQKRTNVILMICTFGGDGNAAYRISRILRKQYCKKNGKFYAFVNGVCASAGTLIALGADELILSDHAELGPIDAQLRRQDEIGEHTSGLTALHALECLQEHSQVMFELHFRTLRFGGGFSTNAAAKIATEITNGLVGELYQQIDPVRIAEVNRFIRIASDYGNRIGKNLKPGALQKLLKGYPAHDFVIDPEEASELFVNISTPKPSLEELATLLKPSADKYLYGTAAHVAYFEHPPSVAPAIAHSSPPDQPRPNHHENQTDPSDKKSKRNGKAAVPQNKA